MTTIKKKIDVEILSKELGQILADESSDFQAEVINAFAKGLKELGSSFRDIQILYILDDLDDFGYELIEDLVTYMKLDKEEENK